MLEQLLRAVTITRCCCGLDKFDFHQPAACIELALHALNDSSGLSWVTAVLSVLANSSSSSSSNQAPDLPTADGLARLLTLPQATALHCMLSMLCGRIDTCSSGCCRCCYQHC